MNSVNRPKTDKNMDKNTNVRHKVRQRTAKNGAKKQSIGSTDDGNFKTDQ